MELNFKQIGFQNVLNPSDTYSTIMPMAMFTAYDPSFTTKPFPSALVLTSAPLALYTKMETFERSTA